MNAGMHRLPHDAQLIARGRTAEVYALNDTQVLKLFFGPQQRGAAAYEADIARRVQATGYPAPAIGESVTIGDRPGILYARVDGIPFVAQVLAQPERAREYARWMAEFHAQMHAHPAVGLPRMRERLETKIQTATPLPPEWKTIALETLARLPEGDRLCHGDFHPNNILMTAHDPVVIDWMDASCGHPHGDLARTLYLLERSAVPPDLPDITQLRRVFCQAYLQRYGELNRIDQECHHDWMLVIAAARLSEDIPEEQADLLAWIAELLSL